MSNGKQCGNCRWNDKADQCTGGRVVSKLCLGGNNMYTKWMPKIKTCVTCNTGEETTGVPCAIWNSCLDANNHSFWEPILTGSNKPEIDTEGSEFEYKSDDGKTDMSLLEMIPNALVAFCELSKFGEGKYKRGSFIDVPNARRRYTAAMWRHYFQEGPDAEPLLDTGKGGSGMAHDIMTMWNAIIRVECRLRGLPLGEEEETYDANQ